MPTAMKISERGRTKVDLPVLRSWSGLGGSGSGEGRQGGRDPRDALLARAIRVLCVKRLSGANELYSVGSAGPATLSTGASSSSGDGMTRVHLREEPVMRGTRVHDCGIFVRD